MRALNVEILKMQFTNVTLTKGSKTVNNGKTYDTLIITLSTGYKIETFSFDILKQLQAYKDIAESLGVKIR